MGEEVYSERGIGDVCSGCQLIQRRAGEAVHQDMTLVATVKRNAAFTVLVRDGMEAEGTVQIVFRVVSL